MDALDRKTDGRQKLKIQAGRREHKRNLFQRGTPNDTCSNSTTFLFLNNMPNTLIGMLITQQQDVR